jgi:hypothetical protein
MGSKSLALSTIVAVTLSGTAVCHPRTGEQLTPDERAALAEASCSRGASLCILRYREQARLAAEIAAGRADESGARRRAMGCSRERSDPRQWQDDRNSLLTATAVTIAGAGRSGADAASMTTFR